MKNLSTSYLQYLSGQYNLLLQHSLNEKNAMITYIRPKKESIYFNPETCDADTCYRVLERFY